MDSGETPTLRDYFAAAALQGFLASRHFDVGAEGQASQCDKAYAYADFMLRSRESKAEGRDE